MNAIIEQNIVTTVFDMDRQAFLREFRAFMANATIPADVRKTEYESTVSAIRQIAVLAGVSDA